MLQGKELSFTNLIDLDSAARIALEFTEPAAAVIKHTNPCGAALGLSIEEAYVRAREADPLAAFGGIIGLNRPIDAATARALVSTFIEAVIAPAVEDEARPILAAKPNMRVVVADLKTGDEGASRRDVRSILGAMLVQQRDEVTEARSPWSAQTFAAAGLKVATKRVPTEAEWGALRFAWRICAHVKSNAVIFTDASRTLAIGAGQMSRVDAVQVAVMKAMSSDGKESAHRIGGRLGRVLSVPRRIGRARESRRDGRRSAGRIAARQRSDCRRRRTRIGDGVYGQAALQALTRV